MSALLNFKPPETGPAQAGLCDVYSGIDAQIEGHQFVQAMTQLLPMLERDPTDVECLDWVSRCAFQLGDTKTALAMLEIIVEQKPTMTLYRMSLGEIRQLSGDVAGAIAECQSILKLDPKTRAGDVLSEPDATL